MTRFQRLLHGFLISFITIAVPLTIAAGVYFRTIDYVEEAPEKQFSGRRAYSTPLNPPFAMFSELDIHAVVRADQIGNLQLELDVREPVGVPKAALFYTNSREDLGNMREWQYLGAVHGPAKMHYRLPKEATDKRVIFIVASLLNSRVLAKGLLPPLKPFQPSRQTGQDEAFLPDFLQ